MGILSDYFDLRKSFAFYGSYHDEKRNQLTHITFVPVIFTTALTFGSHVGLFGTWSLADAAAVFYAASFVAMEPTAGLLYAPLIAAMHYAGTQLLADKPTLAISLHLLGWTAQILAHKFFEKNRPAFLENVAQSLHAAVFFVWLEVLFALGYKPTLFRELQVLVKARKAEMASKHHQQ